MSDRPVRLAVIAVLLLAAVALPFVVPTYYVQFASKVMIMGLLALALNLAVGHGGMVSLCHAALFGIAGYVLALSTPKYDPASLWLTLPLAVGASALVALAIGALALRTRGVYFIMVTLAFGEMLFYLFHDTGFAGGSDGAYVNTKPEIAIVGHALLDLEKPVTFYLVVLGALLASLMLTGMLVRSPFGHALAAARDNERRARSLGFPIFRVRLTAFAISGALAGVAGYFAAAQFGFVAPQMLGWHQSATALVMVLLGGLRSVAGPVLGALVLMGLEEVLKALTVHWKLIEGLIVVMIVLALPNGARQLLTLAFGAPAEAAPPARAEGSAKVEAPAAETGHG
ncbi:branched-chain amino acid ABC transporter permease [Bradyrhizobium sp. U87765 SZCCT0131]|uniref:branched-chain amino acid ABC transporter permease n=1 Tax=unclassified Bradyrhizobium TaxID=2631580 RepID=UPI001BAB45B8|nr:MULTISPECIES: branched-chain amino acid ABC transporter permease [unclassified Bradyrhizobium]MBR1221106.1 branched-chain amino acid ABC transporter permease [Bradyrhizobium sp. U87765 SZCCT0131]MBR1260074.1 branched-chain amino acid ABC transporter permease [Bradyrhizobium sp. U87765 SZCCT0134]MBR1307677.1 branched-chain amino acid ABC transporter permease [Bradyrhizobium sp. U87765 SZCCT0110]MBR1321631.1 branched-chain amino acid ABC transporter permease [Bradyrhizobium sp. U87765 SZCCT010